MSKPIAITTAGIRYKATIPTNEPRDRLSPQDIEILRSALAIYYPEERACLADPKRLERISALSCRLADVSLTWVAEEVAE